jgi:hypothetical protein
MCTSSTEILGNWDPLGSLAAVDLKHEYNIDRGDFGPLGLIIFRSPLPKFGGFST